MGPMVLAIASIEKRDEDKLLEIGVKDSKLLSAKQRESQLKQLKVVLHEFSFTAVQAKEIDLLRDRKSLNEIEAMRVGELLNGLKRKPDLVYVDSPDILQENFAKRIRKYLDFSTVLRTEHKADLNYPIVSAASIIAKVNRDACINEIAKKHGKVGSGYSHDPITIKFLKDFIAKNKCLPDFARKSWLTSQNLMDEALQKKLGDYGK